MYWLAGDWNSARNVVGMCILFLLKYAIGQYFVQR